MNSFQSKYPAFYALLQIFGSAVQDVKAPGSLLVKLSASINLLPLALGFISTGQAGLLGAELTALKASAPDIEEGAAVLVSELAFSSSAAKAIIPAGLAVGDWIVGGISSIEALVAAIKTA